MRKFVMQLSSISRYLFLRGFILIAALVLAPLSWAQDEQADYSELNETELQTLADQGDMHAVFTQGYNLIFDGEMQLLSNPDFDTAKSLLETAHEGGHDTANSILMLYYQGEFGQQADPEKLESLLVTSAERGSAIAELNYAFRYIYSDNPTKSNKALKYLSRATESSVVSETAYPFLVEVLYGVNSDQKKDLTTARGKAQDCVNAWSENAFCQYILGLDFENGWGGFKDLSKRDVHITKAAELGHPAAQWTMGMKYLNGDGVEKNEATAYSWVKKSAEQDHLNGLISFAVMNALGQGTEVNNSAAFKAYETAASLGSGHAMRGLGSMYCAGEAPKTDRDLCGAALVLAYEMNDDQAGQLLGHFFNVNDQASFDTLKTSTAAARDTLINRYDIQF